MNFIFHSNINPELPNFFYWNVQLEFRIRNQLRSFNTNSLDQAFMGNNISFKKAIEKKKMLRCFIDVCEKFEGELHLAGSISLTWDPKLDECYIGVLWVNPEFRGNGLATYILKAIIHFADELGIVLTLLAIPFITPNIKPTDEDILKSKNFFQQLGFKTCLGRTGIAFGCPMDRLPDINHPTKNIPQFMVAAHKI